METNWEQDLLYCSVYVYENHSRGSKTKWLLLYCEYPLYNVLIIINQARFNPPDRETRGFVFGVAVSKSLFAVWLTTLSGCPGARHYGKPQISLMTSLNGTIGPLHCKESNQIEKIYKKVWILGAFFSMPREIFLLL